MLKKNRCALLFVLVSWVGFAQDGTLDPSFGNDGIIITDIDGGYDIGYVVAQQADHKLVVGGEVTTMGEYLSALIRYMPDGSLDESFGVNGIVTFDLGDGSDLIKEVFIREDGKILATVRTGFSSTLRYAIMLFNSNGELDTDFGDNGFLNILSDGSGLPKFHMNLLENDLFSLVYLDNEGNDVIRSRYLPNGSVDTSFGNNGFASSSFEGGSFEISSVRLLDNQSVVLSGYRRYDTFGDVVLMKFLPNGFLDPDFGDTGVATKVYEGLELMEGIRAYADVLGSGKIFVAGGYGSCDSIFQPFFLRFLVDGTPDAEFGDDGEVLISGSSTIIKGVIAQENGRILLMGDLVDCFEGGYHFVRRYFSDGTLDSSFSSQLFNMGQGSSILQSDGKIVTLGNTWWYDGDVDIFLARMNNNPLGLEDFEDNNIMAYPNPSEGIFTVDINFLNASEVDYEVLDVSWKLLQKGVLKSHFNQIDLSEVKTGMYFLRMGSNTIRLLKR